jgi:tetratricopeptide (TPR) repeat protein
MGVMMFDSGAYSEALDNFMRTLALNPYYSPAKLQLGRIYEITGDSGMAKVYFEEFVKTAPILYSDDIKVVKDKLEKYNTGK